MSTYNTNILIVGAGIMGLSVARAFCEMGYAGEIMILEKEHTPGVHASGRNSGVLHAGFYYQPDSLKARFTVEGNRQMTEYCLEQGLPINRCGKVVVARNEIELETLRELKRRGDANGVNTSLIDERELKDIEPNAKTFELALFSPDTSSVEPVSILTNLERKLIHSGVRVLKNTGYIRRAGRNTVDTSKGKVSFNYLINTAGLYADRIAHDFGAGQDYCIVPFRGRYMQYRDSGFLQRHLYPVPDIRYPFLGIHFTRTVDGNLKIGPDVLPAMWKEQYNGFKGFCFSELAASLVSNARLFISEQGYRRLAIRELFSSKREKFFTQASSLVKGLDRDMFGEWLKTGIRAQLIHKKENSLIMDFVLEYSDESLHVLNAVSPAFTSSFAFGAYIAGEVIKRMN